MGRTRGGNTRRGRKSKKDSYRSQLERDFAKNLKKRSVNFDYESIKIPYVIHHDYHPDFIIEKQDGSLMILEAKGYLNSDDRRKMLAVKECNPHLDIRFIFQDSSKKIRKGSKTTYGDWSKKNGFPFADKTLPAVWRREIKSTKIAV